MYDYDFLNIYSSAYKPGTVHCHDTNLGIYFRRYLWQKTMSVFEWKLPEWWSRDYFLYVLYGAGFVTISEFPEEGVPAAIPQYCSILGRDVFYQPKETLIVNPAFKKSAGVRRTIGKDCVLMKLTPDFHGLGDIIGTYADLMALAWESMGVNLLNSKLAFVFFGKNKSFAQSFKAMFDQISEGQPAAFVDKDLLDENGQPLWQAFNQDIKQMFIVPEILEALEHIEAKFDNEIGIPNNVNIQKERVTNDAVHQNDVSTYSKCELWLSNIKKGIEEAVEMFPALAGELDVDFREMRGGEAYAGAVISPGTSIDE